MTLSFALPVELQHWTGPVLQFPPLPLEGGVPDGEARLASVGKGEKEDQRRSPWERAVDGSGGCGHLADRRGTV